MLARIIATGALYKKTLELNLKTIGELTIGKIVNLASNDVQRLDIVSQRLLSTQIQVHHTASIYHSTCENCLISSFLSVFFRPSCLYLTLLLHLSTL